MGNQIKFSPEKKQEDPFSGNDDYRALEIKNIQLKNTNRKLIAKIDQQKQIIKDLKLKLKPKSRSSHPDQPHSQKNQVKTPDSGDYQKLKQENQRLIEELNESKKEIISLKKRIDDITSMGPWNILKK